VEIFYKFFIKNASGEIYSDGQWTRADFGGIIYNPNWPGSNAAAFFAFNVPVPPGDQTIGGGTGYQLGIRLVTVKRTAWGSPLDGTMKFYSSGIAEYILLGRVNHPPTKPTTPFLYQENPDTYGGGNPPIGTAFPNDDIWSSNATGTSTDPDGDALGYSYQFHVLHADGSVTEAGGGWNGLPCYWLNAPTEPRETCVAGDSVTVSVLVQDNGAPILSNESDPSDAVQIVNPPVIYPDLLASAESYPSSMVVGTSYPIVVRTRNGAYAGAPDSNASETRVEFAGGAVGSAMAAPLAPEAHSDDSSMQISCPSAGPKRLNITADMGAATFEGASGEANNEWIVQISCYNQPDILAWVSSPDPIPQQLQGQSFTVDISTRNNAPNAIDANPSVTAANFPGNPPQTQQIGTLASGGMSTASATFTCVNAGPQPLEIHADQADNVGEGPGEANNAWSFTVDCRANRAPSAPAAPALSPSPAYTNSLIQSSDVCTGVTDPDGDPVACNYTFFRNGILVKNSQSSDFGCLAFGCAVGDSIYAIAVACDPFNACSQSAPSNTVAIVPPPCAGLSEDCSFAPCCPGMACNPGTHRCEASVGMCGVGELEKFQTYVFMAIIGLITFVALAYMAGEVIKSPRVTLWAKAEAWQIVASAVIALACIIAVNMFCLLTPEEILAMTPGSADLPRSFGAASAGNMYEASMNYLGRVASYTRGVMAAARYNAGAQELRSSIGIYHCDALCLITSSGVNYAPYSGETAYISIFTMVLNVATISLLSIIFQMHTLQYIATGLFLIMLPIATVMRAIPFMRGFGGALIAIFLSFYIFYPVMIVLSGIVVPQTAWMMTGAGVYLPNRMGGQPAIHQVLGPALGPGSGIDDTEENILGKYSEAAGVNRDDAMQIIKLGGVVFFAAVFMPALGFIAIAAVARETARIIGEEVDIGRLGQMI
jgi:hypothetical protein